MKKIFVLISCIGSLGAMSSQNKHSQVNHKFLTACHDNEIEEVKTLLALNADIDATWQDSTVPEREGEKALHICILADNPDILKLLLEENADPNITNSKGATPLLHASHGGRIKCAEQLLKHNADPNSTLPSGTTPIMKAVVGDHPGIVRLLIKYKANVNAVADRGFDDEGGQMTVPMTALQLASYGNRPQIVKILLQNGAKELPCELKLSKELIGDMLKKESPELSELLGGKDGAWDTLMENADKLKLLFPAVFGSSIELSSADTITFPTPSHFVAQQSGNEKCTDYHERRCNTCNERAFKKCARCESVFYCKQECQRQDWPSHKPVCKKTEKKNNVQIG